MWKHINTQHEIFAIDIVMSIYESIALLIQKRVEITIRKEKQGGIRSSEVCGNVLDST